jgi:hypothetical protein
MVAWRIESCMGLASGTHWVDKHLGPSAATGAAVTANGRFGGNCLQGNSGTFWEGIFDSTATAYAAGAHVFTPLSGSTTELFQLLDATVAHITVNVLPDGTVEIRRGTTGGTILASSAAGVAAIGAYDYWELKALIANAGGTAEVLKNGVSVVSFAGDTQNGGTAAATRARFYHIVSTVAAQIDRWTDMAYGALGAYWGDIRVEFRKPTAEGNSSQWTPLSGTDNSAMVDETTPNDDTDYNSDGTPTNKDTHVHEDLVSTGGTIQGVQINLRARKDDAGARSIVGVARTGGGTEADGAVNTLSTTYVTYTDGRTTKPGGGAWAISDVNAAEFGYKTNA